MCDFVDCVLPRQYLFTNSKSNSRCKHICLPKNYVHKNVNLQPNKSSIVVAKNSKNKNNYKDLGKHTIAPSHGNSLRSSITRLRPGSLNPQTKGVEVKHNSYNRYLKKKQGSVLLNEYNCKCNN